MVVPPVWMRSGLYRVISVCDLVEEFVCVKVLPLRANQSLFAVKDNEKY